jgi:tRNA (cytidine/uridine-2'-O-)-methyltransferase
MMNIVLVSPQIPQNTGAIGRLCVNADAKLHIIKPMMFEITEKAVRRAGLDYWHLLDLTVWESLDDFLQTHHDFDKFFFATTKTKQPYFTMEIPNDAFLFFGGESTGLPMELMQRKKEHMINIPFKKNGRSLNLAISVGIILYDAIRQNFEEWSSA